MMNRGDFLNRIRKILSLFSLEAIIKTLGSILIVGLVFLYDLTLDNSIHPVALFIEKYLDRSIFVSIVAVAFFNMLINVSSAYYRRKKEDSEKIICTLKEAKKLIKQYSLVHFFRLGETEFPGVELHTKDSLDEPFYLNIIDSKKMYHLPIIIETHFDHLMSAHKFSNIFNNLNIRLADFSYNGKTATLKTERTTFFSSLVTNRAADKRLPNGQTLRTILEPGPFLTELPYSQFSNHIGFNLFLITKDQKIIFVNRGKDVSIGKSILGPSIAASLKSKYALNEHGDFTAKGLENGVRKEISDELKIDPKDIEFSLSNNIVSFYRDMIEAGKPQFVGIFFINQTFEKLNQNFRKKITSFDKKKMVIDGDRLFAGEIDEVIKSIEKLDEDCQCVSLSKKNHPIDPTTATALAIAYKFLKEYSNENH